MKRFKAEFRDGSWSVVDSQAHYPEDVVRSNIDTKAEAIRIANTFNEDTK